MAFEFDPHTHSIASGHGSKSTVADIAKKASSIGLTLVGITDHGPATLCAGKASYFRSLAHAPRRRCGIDVLYGIELNILDKNGRVDLADELLADLDYAIISMHRPHYTSGTVEENTFAYVNAMRHPKVKIVGHCDDTRFPVDYEALVVAGKHLGVVLEINEASLAPGGYRGDTTPNAREILKYCKKHYHPVVIGSDSHGTDRIGSFAYAMELIRSYAFPEELILNSSAQRFKDFIQYKMK